MVLHIASNIIWRFVNDEVLILDTNTGNFFSLDTAGAHVWLQVVDGRSQIEIAQGLAAEHNLPVEQMLTDVCELLGSLTQCFEEPVLSRTDLGEQISLSSVDAGLSEKVTKEKAAYKKPTLRDCGQIDHVAAYALD